MGGWGWGTWGKGVGHGRQAGNKKQYMEAGVGWGKGRWGSGVCVGTRRQAGSCVVHTQAQAGGVAGGMQAKGTRQAKATNQTKEPNPLQGKGKGMACV